MKRGRLFLTLVIGSIAGAIGASCTFPSVTFGPDVDGSSPADASVDALQDASSEEAGNDNSDTDDAGKYQDAMGREDAARVDEAGCATPCNCDKDSYYNSLCDTDGGADCDDFDPLIHPQQGFVSAKWESTSHFPAGDWDCNGGVLKQYPHNVSCSISLGACVGEGFQGDPACGETADYFACQGTVLCSLVKTADSPRTQGCK